MVVLGSVPSWTTCFVPLAIVILECPHALQDPQDVQYCWAHRRRVLKTGIVYVWRIQLEPTPVVEL